MTHNKLEGPLTFSCKHQRTALKRCVLSNLRRMAYRTSQPSVLEVGPPHCPRIRSQCAQAGWSTSRGEGGGCGSAVTLRSGQFSKRQVLPQSNRANLSTWHPERERQESEKPHKAMRCQLPPHPLVIILQASDHSG